MQRVSSYLCLAVAAAFLFGCGLTTEPPKPYTSQKDGFSITFPSGAEDPKIQEGASSYDDRDTTYFATNDNGAYRVKVAYWPETDGSKTPMETLVAAGVSPGRETPLDAEEKTITFAGKPAVEATGWSWSENKGADGEYAKMQHRMLGFRADAERVFVITMKTLDKEKLTSKEANDFFNSFKIDGPGAKKAGS